MNWEVILWTCVTLVVIMGVFGIIMSVISATNMKKRRENMKNLYEGLAIGSQVMFAGGIYGRVVGIEEETVNVEIAKGAIMKIDRFAIQTIVKQCKGCSTFTCYSLYALRIIQNGSSALFLASSKTSTTFNATSKRL